MRPALLAIGFLSAQIGISLWQINPTFQPDIGYQGLTYLWAAIEASFQKIATVPILGLLFVAALKRTFEKTFRK